MTTAVTGWTGRGYDSLGDQFCSTFDRHWPVRVSGAVYVDGFDRLPAMPAARGVIRGLFSCNGLAEFNVRHKDNGAAHGETAAGYSFRLDAVKFATQLFIPEAAAKHLPDGEILVWFDADVVTKKAVPEGFVEGLIDGADVVYLGREPKHSEIGFWAVRLSPLARDFLEYVANLYRTDEVFELREWHSAFVWDHARQLFEEHHGLRSRNLTPGGHGHVWPTSPLGKYTEHLKGKRKLPAMRRAA